jgi:transcriptional regulator with XRE-family HTH domain
MQKSNFLKSVGRRISQARTDKGFSKATLAEKANISVSHLSNIERGRKSLSAEVLLRIAEALQVSADGILFTDIPQVHKEIERQIDATFNTCTAREKEIIIKLIKNIGAFIIAIKSEI